MKKAITLLLAVWMLCVILTACGSEPLQLDQSELNLTVGESAELSAGKAVKVNWSSSDDKVAAVNAGTVSAKAPGTATITASLENGEKAECTVTVSDKLIETVTINTASARVAVGSTIQLAASYTPVDATLTKLSWSSSAASIAAVDEQGYVTGISQGTALISCKSENDIEGFCTVIVGEAPEAPTSPPTLPPATEKPAPTTAPTERPSRSSSQSDTPPASAGTSGFLFPDSSDRYLSADEISAGFNGMSGSPITDSFAQDAVNEIFARHGYIFRTPYINAYYRAQSWYSPDPSYDGTLSSIEQYNISLFSNY